jgi:uncharacterized caspase-like protein
LDASKADIEAALRSFRADAAVAARGMRVSAGGVAISERTMGIVFFAGHGLQVHGVNHLVPVDFAVPDAHPRLDVVLKDTARACVSLDAVLEALEDAGVFVSTVLLDCCRDVPAFLPGAHRSASSSAVRGGMGAIAQPPLSDDAGGIFVAFATAPGRTARDESSRIKGHSPFTAALLSGLRTPRRLNDLQMFLNDEVMADTGNEQRPFITASFCTEAGNLVLA